jgi:transposase
VTELAERGLTVDYRTVLEFVHAEKLSYKKDAELRHDRITAPWFINETINGATFQL